ncbi:hypothetical protein BGW80DRAFT_445531 [Lactifluus volemus]|nr:hypothetical protein BGW80DRAFT_445531 [Lactifluus volemus]
MTIVLQALPTITPAFTLIHNDAHRVAPSKVAENSVIPGDPCKRICGSQCVCHWQPSLSQRGCQRAKADSASCTRGIYNADGGPKILSGGAGPGVPTRMACSTEHGAQVTVVDL